MDRYMDCLLDNDLSQLIVLSGSEFINPPTQIELSEAWDKIYLESCQLSQDGSHNAVFDIMKEVEDLKSKIAIANNAIRLLQSQFDQEVVVLLNSMALRCDVKPDDTGLALITKLNGVVARMKRWFPRLATKEAELEELKKDKAGKVDRNYFDDWLELMSAHNGYQIEASKITVARFYRLQIKMKKQEEAEQLKKLAKHAS